MAVQRELASLRNPFTLEGGNGMTATTVALAATEDLLRSVAAPLAASIVQVLSQ